MSHWTTSGRSRLKAKQNRSFAQRAQQRAKVVNPEALVIAGYTEPPTEQQVIRTIRRSGNAGNYSYGNPIRRRGVVVKIGASHSKPNRTTIRTPGMQHMHHQTHRFQGNSVSPHPRKRLSYSGDYLYKNSVPSQSHNYLDGPQLHSDYSELSHKLPISEYNNQHQYQLPPRQEKCDLHPSVYAEEHRMYPERGFVPDVRQEQALSASHASRSPFLQTHQELPTLQKRSPYHPSPQQQYYYNESSSFPGIARFREKGNSKGFEESFADSWIEPGHQFAVDNQNHDLSAQGIFTSFEKNPHPSFSGNEWDENASISTISTKRPIGGKTESLRRSHYHDLFLQNGSPPPATRQSPIIPQVTLASSPLEQVIGFDGNVSSANLGGSEKSVRNVEALVGGTPGAFDFAGKENIDILDGQTTLQNKERSSQGISIFRRSSRSSFRSIPVNPNLEADQGAYMEMHPALRFFDNGVEVDVDGQPLAQAPSKALQTQLGGNGIGTNTGQPMEALFG